MVDERVELLRVDEAARRLSLGRSKTYELVATGELPVVHIGRAVRIPAAALSDWVARQTLPHRGERPRQDGSVYEDADEEGERRLIRRLP